jgi:hypothetical protein
LPTEPGWWEITPTVDWQGNEFSIADVRWRKLNIARVVTTGDWVNNPELSKVDEIGFSLRQEVKR